MNNFNAAAFIPAGPTIVELMITLLTAILNVQRQVTHIHAVQGLGTGTCNSSVGFIGTVPDPGVPEGAFLDVSQNKVYGNGTGDIWRLALTSGMLPELFTTILSMKTLWAGSDTAIILTKSSTIRLSTMVLVWLGFGGGINYDSLDGYFNDIRFPDGPSIPIRNNISAFHIKDWNKDRRLWWCMSNSRLQRLQPAPMEIIIRISNVSWRPIDKRPQLGGCSPNRA